VLPTDRSAGNVTTLDHGRPSSGAGVDGHHACIRIRRELAEHRIGKALLLANILEQARRHAAAQKIVEDGDAKAVFVAQRNRRDADAKVDLLEVALRLQMDRSLSTRGAVVRGQARGFHVAELSLNQIQHLLVGDVARGGDYQMIRREPVPEARAERLAAECSDRFRRA
jgi:hypothetical protein